jgi:hypothetical protein
MSTIRHMLVVLALGCGSSSTTEAPVGSGSVGSGYSALGKKPDGARRPTPPPEIDKRAVIVGTNAPSVDLANAAGGRWTLANALTKHARVMLVFYRGDW